MLRCTSFLGVLSTHSISPLSMRYPQGIISDIEKNETVIRSSKRQVLFFKMQQPQLNLSSYNAQFANVNQFCLTTDCLTVSVDIDSDVVQIKTDFLAHEAVYFIKEKQKILYSNCMNWLISHYQGTLNIDELALVEAISFQVILPPRTIYKEIHASALNENITIFIENEQAVVKIIKNQFMPQYVYNSSLLQDPQPLSFLVKKLLKGSLDNLENLPHAIFLGPNNYLNDIQSQFRQSYYKDDYYMLTGKPIKEQWGYVNQVQFERQDFFNSLPKLANSVQEPCLHFNEYYYTWLLENVVTSHPVACDLGYLNYLQAIKSISGDYLFSNYSNFMFKSLRFSFRLNYQPKRYLITRYNEVTRELQSLVSNHLDYPLPRRALFELLIVLPNRVRKLKAFAKHVKKEILIPFANPNLIFETLRLISTNDKKPVKMDASDPLLFFTPPYLYDQSDPSIYNLLDALQRQFFTQHSAIKKVVDLAPWKTFSFIKFAKKGQLTEITNMMIALLTTEYMLLT